MPEPTGTFGSTETIRNQLALDSQTYTFHLKTLSWHQDVEILNESGETVLYARRPIFYVRSVLAFIGAFLAFFVFAFIGALLVARIDQFQSRALAVAAIICALVLPVVGTLFFYTCVVPRWRLSFFADEHRSVPLWKVIQQKRLEPWLFTFSLKTPENEYLAHWRTNWISGIKHQTWNAFDQHGTHCAQATDASFIKRLFNFSRYRNRSPLLRNRSRDLKPASVKFYSVTEEGLNSNILAAFDQPIGAPARFRLSLAAGNHLELQLLLTLSTVLLLTRGD